MSPLERNLLSITHITNLATLVQLSANLDQVRCFFPDEKEAVLLGMLKMNNNDMDAAVNVS